jgi:hypothetical protein
MIEVFKTNVQYKEAADKIIKELLDAFPGSIINFDLDDCDKILRVENETDIFLEAAALLKTKGFYCEVLE